ncbi:MAG TPA: tetratricopeptide repeat protein [Fimbriimonadaceae bacterium]|nr:hypothetical protein [Armatimonadota bacterium]HCM73025.1 hypothetical protein [Armatimonadota bacterium]HRD30617.1 tetratricopeptide repeat protein [Fimbriimonadaceae bacterium]HRE92722.1 tetratricopeptide repeat protein [Fimbriimonadaceae bacterium]HRI74380.1 tetratricopeptide repeat protein [Fimbriimonadaceae bacterium]
MAQLLWPEESEEAAANLLRISLSRLKKVFGESLIADRTHARLFGVSVNFDIESKFAQLRDALDEVDANHQFLQIKAMAADIRYVGWRPFLDLDTSGVLREWELTGRLAIARLMELAVAMPAADDVELAWSLMTDRGDFDPKVCERLLDAYAASQSLDEASRRIRQAASAKGIPEASPALQALKKYAQTLREASAEPVEFDSSHSQLLGHALLHQMERHAESLGALVALPEVQFHMHSLPSVYVRILDGIVGHLEVGSLTWIEIQAARLSTYASLYDNDRVFEICRLLFPHDMPAARASAVWMHYSFGLFQLRQWDEAISSIQQARELAQQAQEHNRAAVCRITEGAYHWHLGRVDEARAIYDEYLEQSAESDDFSMGINGVICRANYAIIELNYGDIRAASEHIERAYDERHRFNISRMLPMLLALKGVISARQGDIHQGSEFAIEGLKLTFARNSSREGQINMEWACGVLVEGGLKEEAGHIMHWANKWRQQTKHTRSVCEERFAESLGLGNLAIARPKFTLETEYRDVMRHLIKGLRIVQAKSRPSG